MKTRKAIIINSGNGYIISIYEEDPENKKPYEHVETIFVDKISVDIDTKEKIKV